MPDRVVLRLPASSAYVVLARTAAAAMAARLDFPLDRLEDFRLAVDEAAAILLAAADPGAQVECEFTAHDGSLEVSLSVPSRAARPPDPATFAWTVLTALVDTVDAEAGPDSLTITLRAGAGS